MWEHFGLQIWHTPSPTLQCCLCSLILFPSWLLTIFLAVAMVSVINKRHMSQFLQEVPNWLQDSFAVAKTPPTIGFLFRPINPTRKTRTAPLHIQRRFQNLLLLGCLTHDRRWSGTLFISTIMINLVQTIRIYVSIMCPEHNRMCWNCDKYSIEMLTS